MRDDDLDLRTLLAAMPYEVRAAVLNAVAGVAVTVFGALLPHTDFVALALEFTENYAADLDEVLADA